MYFVVTTRPTRISSTRSVHKIKIQNNRGPAGPAGAKKWGSIEGNLSDQTDLDAALNSKVDKVAGKQLSTNDYTTAEKNKLAGVEAGATKNDTDANLKNRANHTGTQTASTISDFQSSVSGNTDVAANTSARHTHSNKAILDATTASYTSAEKTKLSIIEDGAEVNTINAGDNVSELANDAGYITASDVPVAPVTSVNTQTGDVTLTHTDVGADASGAAAQALTDAKDYTDTELTTKADTSALTAHTSNTSNPHNVTKAQVGLGNVDNTSDLNKPVSTATQTALNTKVSKAGDTMTGQLNAPSLGVGSGRLFISTTAPSSPVLGDIWIDLS